MTTLDPTAVLREEHRKILKVASAMERMLEPAAPGTLDLTGIERCVRFLRLYADACHHGKEEDLLFPVLEAHGVPRDSGIMAMMLEEHREGRRLLRRMTDALPGTGAGVAGAEAELTGAGLDYISLIRGHIGKEDGGLFEMADAIVSAPACARLCASYERSCSARFDGCTKAELEELAAEILGSAPRAS